MLVLLKKMTKYVNVSQLQSSDSLKDDKTLFLNGHIITLCLLMIVAQSSLFSFCSTELKIFKIPREQNEQISIYFHWGFFHKIEQNSWQGVIYENSNAAICGIPFTVHLSLSR